ncbi:MAG: class I SAM-dependent methyltransferase [Candidatus Heimdallarchaeota archaeon]|nr:class I SAM-dependent methyltransferase [Candidatus Heimdallarchaeota archaeon]
MSSSEYTTCFYCLEYSKIANDYPINFASKDVDSFTPRCFLHWEYECSKCGKMTHFNGVSWCSSCKKFTCLRCVEEKIEKKEFLTYDYYYRIPCHSCGKYNAALDFAEYEGTHPYQIGDLIPEEDTVVWMPIHLEELKSQTFPHKAWGLRRILSLGKYVEFKRLDSLDNYDPKSTWDALAPFWAPLFQEGGDYHHKYKILPEVNRLLDVMEDEKILDVACGEGNVARNLAKQGAQVTGLDISKLVDYAIEREKEEKLGIKYLKLNAEKLASKFIEASFDKVICNMALMDIENYKTTIEQISYVLKEDGIFVFSITHPAFAWPTCTSFRVPRGSQRNEDKLRLVLNYFDERPTLIDYGNDTPSLQFPRTISSYLNELVKNDLILMEMSEPKASEELVDEFPRQAYLDDETFPDFLIMKTIKKTIL